MGGEFPGNSQGLGAPAPAISSAVIKAGAAPPPPSSPPSPLSGPHQTLITAAGFYGEQLGPLPASSASLTLRKHGAAIPAGSGARTLPGDGPGPASHHHHPRRALRSPRCRHRPGPLHLTARHRHRPTRLRPSEPPVPALSPAPGSSAQSWGPLAGPRAHPTGMSRLGPHHVPPVPGHP